MSAVQSSEPEVVKIPLKDDGTIPNNSKFPLLLIKQAVKSDISASDFENTFYQNGWSGGWRDSIYDFHHYHSNTHEVLGCYAGSAEVQFGGPQGKTVEFRQGDVVVIPAGVAHKKISASADFAVVGAYPGGASWDMNYGKSEEREQTLENIKNVGIPEADPVFGQEGPLLQAWK